MRSSCSKGSASRKKNIFILSTIECLKIEETKKKKKIILKILETCFTLESVGDEKKLKISQVWSSMSLFVQIMRFPRIKNQFR